MSEGVREELLSWSPGTCPPDVRHPRSDVPAGTACVGPLVHAARTGRPYTENVLFAGVGAKPVERLCRADLVHMDQHALGLLGDDPRVQGTLQLLG